ncbi:MAG: 2Fe-2S iron-sulfur cluster-binding protein, partial [Reyranellaceae bacterium]
MKSYRVTIGNTGQTIDCAGNRTVLEAAVAAGIDYPFACATGNCATCISKLDSGKVALLPR